MSKEEETKQATVGAPSGFQRHLHVEWDPKIGAFKVGRRLCEPSDAVVLV